MTEIGTTGVYERNLTIPDDGTWATGDYTIICKETTLSSMDSMILEVTEAGGGTLEQKIDLIQADVTDILDNKWGTATAADGARYLAAMVTDCSRRVRRWRPGPGGMLT